MECDIAVDILRALVILLHPQREIELGKLFNETTNDISESSDSDDNDGEHGKELDYCAHFLTLYWLSNWPPMGSQCVAMLLP